MKEAFYRQCWLGALVLSLAGLLVGCQSMPKPMAAELQPLQGVWEGSTVESRSRPPAEPPSLAGILEGSVISEKPPSSITITIKGNSFHFYRDTNFWFETTIALPAGTNPQELHATITGSAASQASSIGQVVFAIVKIEDGTMTLATEGGGGGWCARSRWGI